MDAKQCTKCGLKKPLKEFSPRTDGVLGRASRCRKCRNEDRREKAGEINAKRRNIYKNSTEKREQLARASARYRETHPDQVIKDRQKARMKTLEIRNSVIMKYGGSCACCGEYRAEFLVVDHIEGNGAGALDRRIHGGTNGVYKMLNGLDVLPKYRVLCHNCNSSLGYYGYCPHSATPQIISDFIAGKI